MKTLALLLLLTACASDAESYCDNVGDCTYKGGNDWIQACDDETRALQSEATAAGCGAAFDAYYACTSASFTCDGITAEFPGCDDELATLDQCLANAQIGTACAELATATSACGGSPDAGPASCTASRDCEARCYLDSVANPCAPTPAEIEAVTTCGASCPP